jgi:hypothetical protein
VAREGQPLDLEHRRTVGSARWVGSRGHRKKRFESLATGIARLREAISQQLESMWAIAECEWNTGGTTPRDLTARSPEVLALGFTSREVLIAECVDAWQSIR